jgi:hypothetical protein
VSENNDFNSYSYGSGEHFAFEVQREFGFEKAAYCLWIMTKGEKGQNISLFLDDILTNMGIKLAAFAAQYLVKFETMPQLSETTREQIILMTLEFDEDMDPDLKRFRNWEEYGF